jgi:hypothetical protein
MEFSPAFYGKCTNLPDGQHRIFLFDTNFLNNSLCEPIVQWLVGQAQDHEFGGLNLGAVGNFLFN